MSPLPRTGRLLGRGAVALLLLVGVVALPPRGAWAASKPSGYISEHSRRQRSSSASSAEPRPSISIIWWQGKPAEYLSELGRSFDAFAAGARSVNASFRVHTSFLENWTDVAGARTQTLERL